MVGEIEAGGAEEAALFGGRDGFDGSAVVAAGSGFDLEEAEGAAVLGDQVDLAGFVAQVAGEDAVAVGGEPGGGLVLAQLAAGAGMRQLPEITQAAQRA